jgi:sugar lactone lactonase YvrE
MIAVDRITEPADQVGESPVWRTDEGALYWVDITACWIHRLELESGRRTRWQTQEQVACIAFDHAGQLVAGMESGMFQVHLGGDEAATAQRVAAPEFAMDNMRFNDGRCDRQGRFWAGTMHRDMAAAHAVGALYRLGFDLTLSSPLVQGLVTQNGLAWSPDGTTMYLSDSHPSVRLIWTYAFDTESGALSSRKVFVDMNQHPGRPDGAAVDADGCYWTCANDGGQLLRFTPAGKLDRSIPLPVSKPSMCAFGGAQMDILFVTSIKPPAAAGRPLERDAGAVFALRPGVQGTEEPRFGASG